MTEIQRIGDNGAVLPDCTYASHFFTHVFENIALGELNANDSDLALDRNVLRPDLEATSTAVSSPRPTRRPDRAR